MTLNLPYKVRAALYILIVLGSPTIAYAYDKKWIGAVEVTFWLALTSAIALLAALNVTKTK